MQRYIPSLLRAISAAGPAGAASSSVFATGAAAPAAVARLPLQQCCAWGQEHRLQQHAWLTDTKRCFASDSASTSSGGSGAFSSSTSTSSGPIGAESDAPGPQQQQQQQQQQQAAAGGSPTPPAVAAPPPLPPPPPPPQQQPAFKSGARLVQPLRRGGPQVVAQEGIVHINCSLNNTLIVLTDLNGQVKTTATGGSVGFKNAGKSSPLAAERAAAEIARRALEKGFYNVSVRLRGMGRNKQIAVQALAAGGVTVTQLREVTPTPYNGCRLPRKRRV